MTHVVTYKRAWRFSTQLRYGLGVLLFAVWLFLPSLGKAQIEGIRCAPEPTDMFIKLWKSGELQDRSDQRR